MENEIWESALDKVCVESLRVDWLANSRGLGRYGTANQLIIGISQC